MRPRKFLLFFVAVILAAFFVRTSTAFAMPCFDLEIAENTLREHHNERVVGVGITFDGNLMKFYVSPNGRWTIGVVPASRDGLFCILQMGDQLQEVKPPQAPSEKS